MCDVCSLFLFNLVKNIDKGQLIQVGIVPIFILLLFFIHYRYRYDVENLFRGRMGSEDPHPAPPPHLDLTPGTDTGTFHTFIYFHCCGSGYHHKYLLRASDVKGLFMAL
jgi:hypothetical protein